MTTIVNLYGGAGSGKSTTATGVFHLLKLHGVSCEYVSEYAKDKVYEGTLKSYYNPFHIASQQYNRLFRLVGKVDIAVTDSPLLQQAVYNEEDKLFREMCMGLNDRFDNVDYFINRPQTFEDEGRIHTLEESQEIDDKTLRMLGALGINYKEIHATHEAANVITNDILHLLGRELEFAVTNIKEDKGE